MSIRNQIIYGYALALSIALGGTLTGLILGNHYQKQALQQRQIASNERKILSNLQVDILDIQPAKDLSPYLNKPEEFLSSGDNIIEQIDNIRSVLANYNPSTLAEIQPLIEQYEVTVGKFSLKMRQFLDQVAPMTSSPDKALAAEKLLNKLVQSEEFKEFSEFPKQLKEFYNLSQKQELMAELSLKNAEKLRTRIIVTSLILSMTIAIIIAIHISKTIARPIQTLTKLAEKVTQESDFNLQSSVTNNGEIGILAGSLNQLIQKVKILLDEEQKYTKQVEEAKEIAEKANLAKNEFLASMSHELRTPLNGILGYTQILSLTNLTENQKYGINVIHQCSEHLLNLFNEVLDLAKIEASKIELYTHSFELAYMLEGIVGMCSLKAKQKNINFFYHKSANLPFAIVADEKRLRQILLNLLENAIKFTDYGQVIFQVTAEETASQDKVKLHFLIQDSGLGISNEDKEKIFLPFERGQVKEYQREGTGLGLAISQNLVKKMGSQIEVKSELGKGSIFEFTLECPIANDWIDITSIINHRKIIGYTGTQRSVLLVDDHWENRKVLVDLLTPLGFIISEATNGKEGLELAQQYQFDLIIYDLKMPLMDGEEMLAQLEELGLLKNIIVITSSAYQKSSTGTSHDFLPKPVQAEKLYQMLAKHLQLDWVYETKDFVTANGNDPSKQLLSTTSLEMMPSEWLHQLHQTALELNKDKILNLINQIPPENLSLKETLKAKVNNFDFEEIFQISQEILAKQNKVS